MTKAKDNQKGWNVALKKNPKQIFTTYQDVRTDRPSSQVTKPDRHSLGSSNNCYVSLYTFL